MTRRATLATAGAITIVLLAAAAAIAANLGVLWVATDTGTAGGLDATDLATTVTAPQHPGDPEPVRGDDQGQDPGYDGPTDDRSGIEPDDGHRPADQQPETEHYEGRDDDD